MRQIGLTILLAVLVTAAMASVADAREGCNSSSCERRVERKQCARGGVDACLRVAARRHGVPYTLLRAIATCESGLRADARNPTPVGPRGEHASGVMQFLPSTFAGTPYRGRSIWSPRWNTLAGAWLISRVGTGPWAASRHCWA